MDRSNPRQALIVCVQSSRHGRQSGHKPAGGPLIPIGTAEQSFDLASLAHDEARTAPLDQGRSPQQQAFVAAGEPEVVWAGLAQMPHPNHLYIVALSGTYVNKIVTHRHSDGVCLSNHNPAYSGACRRAGPGPLAHAGALSRKV